MGEGTQVITLEKSGNNYLFNVGTDGYLYAASSGSNYLKTEKTADDKEASDKVSENKEDTKEDTKDE